MPLSMQSELHTSNAIWKPYSLAFPHNIVDLIKLWLGVSERGYCIIWKGEAHKRWLHRLIEFSYVFFFHLFFLFQFKKKTNQHNATLLLLIFSPKHGGFSIRGLWLVVGTCVLSTHLHSSMHAREHRANGKTCLKVWLSTLRHYCAPEQHGPK